jgi:hypothetical protein
MKTMLVSTSKIAAGILTLGLLGGELLCQTRAQGPSALSEAGSASAKKAAGITPDQFDKLRALIKPKPGGFDDLPWMTDLWEGRRKAAAEGKPLLVWVGDGHPLGWT